MSAGDGHELRAGDAREQILGRVRAALEEARGGRDFLVPRPPPEREAPHPEEDSVASRLERFRAMLERVGGHVHVVVSEEEAAEVLARLLDERGVQSLAVSDAPLVRRLVETLPRAPKLVQPGAPRAELLEADAGLTGAQAAIAETGTLVLDSDAERHRLASLVPPVHVAVLDERAIRGDLDGALAELSDPDPARMARAVTFVTGPSRTADIELTLVVGVHGPRELHVLCLLSP